MVKIIGADEQKMLINLKEKHRKDEKRRERWDRLYSFVGGELVSAFGKIVPEALDSFMNNSRKIRLYELVQAAQQKGDFDYNSFRETFARRMAINIASYFPLKHIGKEQSTFRREGIIARAIDKKIFQGDEALFANRDQLLGDILDLIDAISNRKETKNKASSKV